MIKSRILKFKKIILTGIIILFLLPNFAYSNAGLDSKGRYNPPYFGTTRDALSKMWTKYRPSITKLPFMSPRERDVKRADLKTSLAETSAAQTTKNISFSALKKAGSAMGHTFTTLTLILILSGIEIVKANHENAVLGNEPMNWSDVKSELNQTAGELLNSGDIYTAMLGGTIFGAPAEMIRVLANTGGEILFTQEELAAQALMPKVRGLTPHQILMQRLNFKSLLSSNMLSLVTFMGWELGAQLWEESLYLIESNEERTMARKLWPNFLAYAKSLTRGNFNGDTKKAQLFKTILENMLMIVLKSDSHRKAWIYNTWRLRILRGDFVAIVICMSTAAWAGSAIGAYGGALIGAGPGSLPGAAIGWISGFIAGLSGGLVACFIPQNQKDWITVALQEGRYVTIETLERHFDESTITPYEDLENYLYNASQRRNKVATLLFERYQLYHERLEEISMKKSIAKETIKKLQRTRKEEYNEEDDVDNIDLLIAGTEHFDEGEAKATETELKTAGFSGVKLKENTKEAVIKDLVSRIEKFEELVHVYKYGYKNSNGDSFYGIVNVERKLIEYFSYQNRNMKELYTTMECYPRDREVREYISCLDDDNFGSIEEKSFTIDASTEDESMPDLSGFSFNPSITTDADFSCAKFYRSAGFSPDIELADCIMIKKEIVKVERINDYVKNRIHKYHEEEKKQGSSEALSSIQTNIRSTIESFGMRGFDENELYFDWAMIFRNRK
ncbi:MAG: hypothetical protein ABIA04_13870 [Pseudomonadota bacterium]